MPILNSAYFTECRRHIVIPCGKVCRIKNRHTFRILPILNSAYFKSMPILNSSYHAVKYAELRIGSILKVCRFVIRHITQTETQTETEANFTHVYSGFLSCQTSRPASKGSNHRMKLVYCPQFEFFSSTEYFRNYFIQEPLPWISLLLVL